MSAAAPAFVLPLQRGALVAAECYVIKDHENGIVHVEFSGTFPRNGQRIMIAKEALSRTGYEQRWSDLGLWLAEQPPGMLTQQRVIDKMIELEARP